MANTNSYKFLVEAFDSKVHSTKNFSCGNSAIDNYLQRTAKRHVKNNIGRIWVVADKNNNVIGYYGVAANVVDLDDMPEGDINYQKIVGYDKKFPAVFITMFGVDKNWQSKKIGTRLIRDALKMIQEVSKQIGIFCVVLNVGTNETSLSEKNILKQFYQKLGFETFPQKPFSMFMTIKKIYNRYS